MYYDLFPFERHPLWTAIQRGELSLDQVLQAETQHYIRTRAGQSLRQEALLSAKSSNEKIAEMLLETYLEEVQGTESEPSHLVLIERLLKLGGVTDEQIQAATPSVGNALAMAMYREISRRGAGCHMLAAGAVEFFYSQLCPSIFEAYTETYRMSHEQALTYSLHGPMDKEHAERAFSILPEAIKLHGWESIELSVRDAFAATSVHYDGMLEAATGVTKFWNGEVL